MNPVVIFELEALEDLIQLAGRDRRQAGRIVAALERYLRYDDGDVKKLAGRDNEWRLRVGDWRVIFKPDARDAVHVLAIRLRRDAYE